MAKIIVCNEISHKTLNGESGINFNNAFSEEVKEVFR